jgi:hypothetical protein
MRFAEKASATLTGMPSRATRNIHRMEDVIVKMAELEAEINADIDKLVTLKKDINRAIKGLSKPNYSMVLELRYLSFKNLSTSIRIVFNIMQSIEHFILAECITWVLHRRQ